MRVLIIDNNSCSSLAITYMLKASGIVADCAGSARRAVELCGCHQYDILLLDLILPDMSGAQLVRRLRAINRNRPMLVLSRVLQPQACATALDAGADDFMQKPFERSELMSRIHLLLGQRQRAAERMSGDSDVLRTLSVNLGYACLCKPFGSAELLVAVGDALQGRSGRLRGVG